MTDELFRSEVMATRQRGEHGKVSLLQPLRLRLLAGFAVAATLAIVSLLVMGEYSRRSRVSGQLVPDLGLATVVAPAAGVVGRLFADEGDPVRHGAALLRIDIPRALADGNDSLALLSAGLDVRDTSTARLGRSQIAQIDAQLAGTRQQVDIANRELAQIEQAIATSRVQVRLGRDSVERYRRIAAQKFVSQLEIDQQEQQLLSLLNQQQALERQATAIRRGIAQMRQTMQELPAQRAAQVAATARERALIDQERVQQQTGAGMLIEAPVAGLVANRLIEPGQSVQVGQPLLSLLPRGSILHAQLLVPSRAIGFVSPGDIVLLRYEAYPHQKFGHHRGRVIRVSRSAIDPGDPATPARNGQGAEPYYRVLVALEAQSLNAYGKPEPLRPGMLLEADILGERRKLYEWLLEPLYALRGTISAG